MQVEKIGDMVRITKAKARKLFASGTPVYLIPGGLRLDSLWCCFYLMRNSEDFETQINAFDHYNQDLTKRYGIKYFIKNSIK